MSHKDESVVFNEFTFKVIKANQHQVQQLYVTVAPPTE